MITRKSYIDDEAFSSFRSCPVWGPQGWGLFECWNPTRSSLDLFRSASLNCSGTISVTGPFLWRNHFCGRIISMTGPFLWPDHFCGRTISVVGSFLWRYHFCDGTICASGSFLCRNHFCDGIISVTAQFLWWLHFCAGYTFVTGTFLSGYYLCGETIFMAESFIHFQKQRYIKSNTQNSLPSKITHFSKITQKLDKWLLLCCFVFFLVFYVSTYFFQDSILRYTPRFEKRYVRKYIVFFFSCRQKMPAMVVWLVPYLHK